MLPDNAVAVKKEDSDVTDQSNSENGPVALDWKAGFNQYLDLSKNQLAAIAALGFRFYQQGSLRDARTIFEGLIVLDPSLYYGHAGLGAIALRDERLDDAVTHLQRAAELKPDDPAVHANLGEALLRQAKFTEAASEFEQALNLDPGKRNPGANRARAILQGMNLVVREMKRVAAA
jgi:tetratricopeptide (TPR) repeat protein